MNEFTDRLRNSREHITGAVLAVAIGTAIVLAPYQVFTGSTGLPDNKTVKQPGSVIEKTLLTKASAQAQDRPPARRTASDLDQLELSLHNRINAHRRKYGLKPLRDNSALRRAARQYSRRMSEEGFFSHTDPQGRDLGDRVAEAGFTYRMLGENIAKNTNVRDPVATAEQGWMNSQGHRENILQERFTETGVGIWRAGRSYHFTQIFLRP